MEDRLVKSFEQICQEQIDPMFSNETYLEGFRQNIRKAMTATGLTGAGDAGPLLLEDLDATMTSILFDEQHLKMFNVVPRVPATQVYYEFNKRKQYGTSRRALGFVEGGAPHGGISKYERVGRYVKFLGNKGGYTHQLMTVGQAGGIQLDPVADENRNRTLELLESLDRWILWGDEDIEDEAGNAVNYDGIITQLGDAVAANVIDMEGAAPNFDMFEDIGFRLFQTTKLANFANIKCFMHGQVLTDLTSQLRAIERRELTSTRPSPLAPGEPLAGIQTNFGWMPFIPHVFMDAVDGNLALAVADPSSPAAPATVTGAATAGGVPGLPAGTYWHKVSAVNDKGESLPTQTGSGTVATEGQKVTLTIARVTGATFYRVYRAEAQTDTHYYIGHVVQPVSGDAPFVDQQEWMPNTSICLVGNFVPADIALAQLAPLLKFPLAVVSTTIEFLLLLYHTLVLKAPERFFLLKNIGQYSAT